MKHVCYYCRDHQPMTHAEWKRHLYLAHGLSDGNPDSPCRPASEPVEA